MNEIYGNTIRSFFIENEIISAEDGIYAINHGIQSNDISFTPVKNFIELHKPKILYYMYPTEFSVEWLMDEILKNDDNERKNIENILLENNTKLKLVIGSDNPDYYKGINLNPPLVKNFEILYWPTHILWLTYEMMHDSCFQDGNKTENIQVNTITPNFERLYVNYNNKPRIHRCMMMDYLFKNNLFDYGFNSWNQLQLDNNRLGSNADVAVPNETTYNFKYWTEQRLSIDGYMDSSKDFIDEHSYHLYNPNTFMALVGETAYGISPITEKTYRCILQQQPFLAFGGVNQNQELTRYGFKMYDEIFDYSFESSAVLEDRIQGVINNLNNIKDRDYDELYQLIKPKLEYNQNRAIEIIKNDVYCPNELVNVAKKYRI